MKIFISTITDFKVSPKIIKTDLLLKLNKIKSILGIPDIESVFLEYPDFSDVENMMIHINKNYDLNLYRYNPYEFITSFIKIDSLMIMGADKPEYYDHMSIEDALERILLFLLKDDNKLPSKNGFPQEFNVIKSNIPFNYDGDIIFPYMEINETCNDILSNVLEILNIEDNNLYYHGTN